MDNLPIPIALKGSGDARRGVAAGLPLHDLPAEPRPAVGQSPTIRDRGIPLVRPFGRHLRTSVVQGAAVSSIRGESRQSRTLLSAIKASPRRRIVAHLTGPHLPRPGFVSAPAELARRGARRRTCEQPWSRAYRARVLRPTCCWPVLVSAVVLTLVACGQSPTPRRSTRSRPARI